MRTDNPLHGIDGQLMVMAAHRYCLGRRSYIVKACLDWLRKWWKEFDENTRAVIVRDTISALMDGGAGGDYVAADWLTFARWAWNLLSEIQKDECRLYLAYKKKPWPLD